MLRALHPRLRWLVRCVALAVAVLGALELAVRFTPLPLSLREGPPTTPVVVDVNGQTIAELPLPTARLSRPVPLDQMGSWLPLLTVQLEDQRFYQHSGLDVRRTFKALLENVRSLSIISGASTITQQTIKLASGRFARSWSAKVYEILAAIRLEREWGKERILTEYLNRSDYGNRLIGPAAAARMYFNKTPASLSFAEALYLAGLPQSPTRRNPWRRPECAQARLVFNCRLLSQRHAVPADDLASATRVEITPIPARWPEVHAPHFVAMLMRQLPAHTEGIIRSSLDLPMQLSMERLVSEHMDRVRVNGVQTASMIVLDHSTGGVRALVGSGDFRDAGGQLNGATLPHSSGSTLKPFLYLKAIDDRKLTAASILPDTSDAVRAAFADYDPLNFDHRYLGPVRVREALANSLNVPAVVAAARLGARSAWASLERAGLTFSRRFVDYGAGFILGNADVRLLDMTGAYAAFARDGLALDPHLLAAAPVRERALATPEATWIVADILSDNNARTKTFGIASPLAFKDLVIPVKTGTSSGFRDAWTLGCTQQHTVGVWAGRSDGQPLRQTAAIAAAAPLWRLAIDVLIEQGDHGLPSTSTRSGLLAKDVCTLTGLLPCADSPARQHEFFLPGTEPNDSARASFVHRDGRAIPVLPEAFALWCQSRSNHLGAEVDRRTPLRIAQPVAGARFVLDKQLPRDHQQIQLVATGGGGKHVDWQVDQHPVPQRNGMNLWPLEVGEHLATATTEDGVRVKVSFSVE